MWQNAKMPNPKCENNGTLNVEPKNEMPTKPPPNPKSTLCDKNAKSAKKKKKADKCYKQKSEFVNL